MATDAAVASPVDASALSDAQLTPSVEPGSQHVLDRATLNGSPAVDEIENKHITNVEDQANSADVSVSGGSDTEASKGDSSGKSGDGDKAHLKASSAVKKPATFKAVSVNKTFLASKGATANTLVSKPTEKSSAASSLSTTPTGSAALSASRPRLVAKSGSGTGSLPKFSSLVNGGKASTGPDPNVVWNKNRPVPPPEPKQFTDEELQKYGIHMASRLGPDSQQSQNNWADIDEDEDDWAPDTITWTDGTKVTLPHPDDDSAPAPDSIPAAIPEATRLIPEKSMSPALQETASSTTKPGVLSSGKGLVFKGSSAEKPALVAKPPPSTSPAKSPWAKLPPVERASPVGAEHLQPSAHLPFREGAQYAQHAQHVQHVQHHSAPPPREIAADDFNRSSWRDGPTLGNRELYNSQSGRYEPVGDRRGSMRSDSQYRQPSLLQRPSQSDHPEPSPAFQTHRTAQEGSLGRRRGSSNLSGGNAPYFQKSNFPPHEHSPNARRSSLTASAEGPESPTHISTSGHHGGTRNLPPHSGQQQASPASAHISPQAPSAQPVQPQPAQPSATQPQQVEEDFEVQKKIMHEKRELAYRRRREQEEREEAEKRERIKAKLEAMGPAPERKSTKKESPAEVPAVPVQIQQRQHSAGREQTTQPTDAAVNAGLPPPPSQPTTTGDKALSEEKADGEKPDMAKNFVPPHLRGRPDVSQPTGEQSDASTNLAPAPPHLRGRQEQGSSWSPSAAQPDRFTSWSSSAQQVSSNVWAPNNTRGLGNGTFNASLGRAPASPHVAASPQLPKGPAPIAPPSSQRTPSASLQQGSVVDERPNPESIKSRWSNAILESDRATREQAKARMAEHERQLAERGISFADSLPEIKDRWQPHSQNAAMKNAPDAMHRANPPTGPKDRATSANLSGPGSTPMLPSSSSTSQSRSSRFFPAKDSRHEAAALPELEPEAGRPGSPSPPPPDAVGHPVFDGDVHHPHVSLPRPQPVVRLPPASGSSSASAHPKGSGFSWASPTPFHDATTAPPTQPRAEHASGWGQPPTRPGAHGNVWNERFQTLLSDRKPPTGRKVTSPPRASVVEPSSRSALDQSTRGSSATVSLPQRSAAPMGVDLTQSMAAARKHFKDEGSSFAVKPLSEVCFEEQEMGSLPLIRIPREAPDAAWHPASPPPSHRPGDPRKLISADITSHPQHWIGQDIGTNGSPEYRIHLPGTNCKTVPAPPLRSRSNPRRGSSRGPRMSHGPRGGKSRDTSSQSGDGATSQNSRGGRGGYRGRGSDWSRRTSSSQPA